MLCGQHEIWSHYSHLMKTCYLPSTLGAFRTHHLMRLQLEYVVYPVCHVGEAFLVAAGYFSGGPSGIVNRCEFLTNIFPVNLSAICADGRLGRCFGVAKDRVPAILDVDLDDAFAQYPCPMLGALIRP